MEKENTISKVINYFNRNNNKESKNILETINIVKYYFIDEVLLEIIRHIIAEKYKTIIISEMECNVSIPKQYEEVFSEVIGIQIDKYLKCKLGFIDMVICNDLFKNKYNTVIVERNYRSLIGLVEALQQYFIDTEVQLKVDLDDDVDLIIAVKNKLEFKKFVLINDIMQYTNKDQTNIIIKSLTNTSDKFQFLSNFHN